MCRSVGVFMSMRVQYTFKIYVQYILLIRVCEVQMIWNTYCVCTCCMVRTQLCARQTSKIEQNNIKQLLLKIIMNVFGCGSQCQCSGINTNPNIWGMPRIVNNNWYWTKTIIYKVLLSDSETHTLCFVQRMWVINIHYR